MNFSTLVMQLLETNRRVDGSYSVDNAIADATKVKLAHDAMSVARRTARNSRGVVGSSYAGTRGRGITGRGGGMSGSSSGGSVPL